MRLVVPCQGEHLSDPVDSRFGRARNFIVFDSSTSKSQVLSNDKQIGAAHGAGTAAVEMVLREHVEVVLTPRCGPKAMDLFVAAGVKLFAAREGTVADAIAAWERGELAPIEDAHAPSRA